MILHCPHCGLKVAPSAKDCPSCSRRMIRECPACAETIAVDSAACKYCGEHVTPVLARAPERPAARPAAPDVQFLEEPVTHGCSWENTQKGIVRRWWGTFFSANFRPGRFFRAMPQAGGHRWPVGFAYGIVVQFLFVLTLLLVAGNTYVATQDAWLGRVLPWLTAGGLLAAIPVTFLGVTGLLYGASLLWHVLLKVLGGKGAFQGTLRVVSYSTSALGWLLLPGLGLVLTPLMWSVQHYHGFRQVHGLGRVRAFFAAIFPFLLMAGLVVAGIKLGYIPSCCGAACPAGRYPVY
jgi:hypothetical protein